MSVPNKLKTTSIFLFIVLSVNPVHAKKFADCLTEWNCQQRTQDGLKLIRSIFQQNDLSIIEEIVRELQEHIVHAGDYEVYLDEDIEWIFLRRRHALSPWRDTEERILYPANLKRQLLLEARAALAAKRTKLKAAMLKFAISDFRDKPVYPRTVNIEIVGKGVDGQTYTVRFLELKPNEFHAEISPAYLPVQGIIQAALWPPDRRINWEEGDVEPCGASHSVGWSVTNQTYSLAEKEAYIQSIDQMCKARTPQGVSDTRYQITGNDLFVTIKQSRDEDSIMAQNRSDAIQRYATTNANRLGIKGGGKVGAKAGVKGKAGIPLLAEGEVSGEVSVEAFIEGNYEITESEEKSAQFATGSTQERRFIFRRARPVLGITLSKSNRSE